jgi:hypothetical protein
MLAMNKFALAFLPLLCSLATARAETVTLPLQEFTASSTMEMRCTHGLQSLSIPVPERWKLRKASLALRYTVSNNLIGNLSQMTIRVNKEPIAQTKLTPQNPSILTEYPIPLAQLKPGYNTIDFEVVQHHLSGECELPCAPDLWTNVSLTDSTLQFEYDLKPLPLKLGEVAGLIFDPKQFPEAMVNIVTENVTRDSVTLAGIVASGVARRFDYRKVKFGFSNQIKQDMDNVLIGSEQFAESAGFSSENQSVSSDAGLLKISHLPNGTGGVDDKHALIFITGEKSAALKVVAEILASMTLPYPGTGEMHSYGFSMSDISMYSGRQTISADKVYDFKTLNQPTYTFEGLNPNPIILSFRLPPDFLIKQNQYAKLSINLSYGAGLRPGSGINIVVNDKPLRAIQLDSVGGSYVDGYKVDMPTHLFKPGANTISFSPFFNMDGLKLCDAVRSEGLFATIYENSTLYFPDMPHFVELPKVELFALNGFPFTRWPDGYETMIYLPQQDTASIETALNVIGMITQKNGFPLFSTQVRFEEPKGWNGELLVIGKTSSIPKSIMEAAPMGLTGITNVPYPISRGWDTEAAISNTRQQSGLGHGIGALMEFESIYKRGRSILLLTAENSEDLSTLGDAMLEPNVQGRLKGDAALIELTAPKYKVTAMAVGKKYTTGDQGEVSLIDSFLHEYLYVFYGLVAALIVILAMFGYWVLRRYRAKRTGGAKNQPS